MEFGGVSGGRSFVGAQPSAPVLAEGRSEIYMLSMVRGPGPPFPCHGDLQLQLVPVLAETQPTGVTWNDPLGSARVSSLSSQSQPPGPVVCWPRSELANSGFTDMLVFNAEGGCAQGLGVRGPTERMKNLGHGITEDSQT